GPELLWEAVEPLIGDRTGELNVLDLGCGTGLTGAAFRAVAGRLVGVDLSPRMLGYAQQRGVYDELQQCDLVEFLQSTDERFDLIVAADVLIYLGDLVRAFEEIGRVLRPGGHWVASAEC